MATDAAGGGSRWENSSLSFSQESWLTAEFGRLSFSVDSFW